MTFISTKKQTCDSNATDQRLLQSNVSDPNVPSTTNVVDAASLNVDSSNAVANDVNMDTGSSSSSLLSDCDGLLLLGSRCSSSQTLAVIQGVTASTDQAALASTTWSVLQPALIPSLAPVQAVLPFIDPSGTPAWMTGCCELRWFNRAAARVIQNIVQEISCVAATDVSVCLLVLPSFLHTCPTLHAKNTYQDMVQ